MQARLGQLHQRLNQLSQLANTEAPTDRVGLGSRVTVLDLDTNDTDTYMVVLAEMMDFDAGHISLASPLGRALSNGRVGDEISLRLPTSIAEAPHPRARHRASGRRDRHLRATAEMEFPKKQLLVVGDRVLITPEDGDDRTRVGLYLPATAHRRAAGADRPHRRHRARHPDRRPQLARRGAVEVDAREGESRGMQARVGDHAIFFRKAAVEISFEEKKYLVVPQAAILVLIRDDLPI